MFGNGGITTMGVNILNMGAVGGFVGFYSFKGLKAATRSVPVSAFIAAWLACLIPALCASVELWLAGTFPLEAGLVAMGIYHCDHRRHRGYRYGRRHLPDYECPA